MTDTTDTTSNTTNPNTVTSDEQVAAAKEMGFEPTQAWVLTNPPKKPRSPGAERVKKSRDRAREKGIVPLNVPLPQALHGFVRELAKRTCAGASLEAALADIVPPRSVPVSPRPAKPLTVPELTDLPVWPTLPSWKRWLLRQLIRSKS